MPNSSVDGCFEDSKGTKPQNHNTIKLSAKSVDHEVTTPKTKQITTNSEFVGKM